MANVPYQNFVLENKVEDQFNSHLDLNPFCTIDRSLVGTAGMIKKIHRYSATNGTQKLTLGNGNTLTIEASYTEQQYEILLAQNRGVWYDEEQMTDPMIGLVIARHAGTDMFNTVNADIYDEFKKAELVVLISNNDYFGAFVDGQSLLNVEAIDAGAPRTFAFVSPAELALIRKALKDDLKYVESYARTGYVGTVGGTNLYVKKDALTGTICLATREAVTMFVKKGVESELYQINNRSADDANVRKNTLLTRKYYLAALTDATKAVKLMKGTAAVSTDTTVDSTKTYYELSGAGYVAVTPVTGDNPATKGWYEITPAVG